MSVLGISTTRTNCDNQRRLNFHTYESSCQIHKLEWYRKPSIIKCPYPNGIKECRILIIHTTQMVWKNNIYSNPTQVWTHTRQNTKRSHMHLLEICGCFWNLCQLWQLALSVNGSSKGDIREVGIGYGTTPHFLAPRKVDFITISLPSCPLIR